MKRTAAVSALAVALSALVAVACSTAAPSSAAPPRGGVESQFVGNWELVSYELFREGGEVVEMNYVGRIMYDAHGTMSAIGMPRDLPQQVREGEPQPRAGFAYFAKYQVDPAAGSVVHNVHGSPMSPSWVNTGLVRYYEFSGDRLMLSLRDPNGRVTGTLTWRRLQ